jgi:hypothetical protein
VLQHASTSGGNPISAIDKWSNNSPSENTKFDFMGPISKKEEEQPGCEQQNKSISISRPIRYKLPVDAKNKMKVLKRKEKKESFKIWFKNN